MSSAAAKGEKQNKRRIPEGLRRRALVSCDRCKLRRVRCIRPSEQDTCNSCLNSGVKCESTLPRKQRVYGSVETLSVRYRALDALIKGLFPDQKTDDSDTLFRIAERLHIQMPGVDDQTPATEAFSQSSPPVHVSLPPSVAAAAIGPSTPGEAAQTSNIAEEKLIPTPHGVSHYVGPSSSFRFAATVRNMVAQCNAAPDGRRLRRPHSALIIDFASLQTSKALEPRISGQAVDGVDEEAIDLESEEPAVDRQRAGKRPGPAPDADNYRPTKRLKTDANEDILPSRELADTFVRAFFEHVHPNYALFHRAMFQLRYEPIWESPTTALRGLEPGWLCCLFMVFIFGAQASKQLNNDQYSTVQKRYLSIVRSHFQRLIYATSLVNVQALLLLQLYEHNAGERNSAWMLLGCASRMAIALGMHREGASVGFDPIERNIRRRVWWTLYTFEQNLCLMLGRPSAIDDTEVNVCLPDEAMLDGGDLPPDYPKYALHLTRMSPRVKRLIYAAAGVKSFEDELPVHTVAKQLLQDLDAWHRALPRHLHPEWNSMMPKQRRSVLLLHIYYYHIKSIITRPYLLHKVNLDIRRLVQKEQNLPNIDPEVLSFSQTCSTSAREAINYLHQLAASDLLDGVAWLDVYYIYHGVLILCLEFLARPRGTEDSADDLARKAAVSSILSVACNSKLSPTFQILAQVAVQFALIVDALEDPHTLEEGPQEPDNGEPMQQPPAQAPPDSRTQDVSGIISDWFQHDAIDLPWDFFDMGSYGDLPNSFVHPLPAPYSGTFAEPPAGFDEVDDWAAHTLRELTKDTVG
jgi:proline utilization trans-activator